MDNSICGHTARRHVTLGTFTWEKGSINDNICKILRKNNINYRFTLEQLEADVLGINIWEQVRHTLNDDVCEVFVGD